MAGWFDRDAVRPWTGRWSGRDAIRPWIRSRLIACGQGLVLGVLSFAGGVPLLILTILSIAFIPLFGVGLLLVPIVMTMVRALANERRRLAAQWSGTPIPVPYRPRPPVAPIGVVGSWQRCRWLLTDPATWRDILWLLCSPINLALGLLPVGLLSYAVEGIVVVPAVAPHVSTYGYGLGWLVDLPGESWWAIPQGLLLIPLGLALGPAVLGLNDRFNRSLLAPTRSAALDLRVRELTETRAEAVDTQAAELRRIERDLHDGAQARLVALGMSLGMAEDLFTTRPDTARRLLAEARHSSDQALAELRDLVRGIHPPVLAERGLDDAVRALALALPLPVQVDIDLPGRAQAPVESAAYFAVAEALANIAKHSGAHRAWVRIRYARDRLVLAVGDDGTGGADPRHGTGLRGIQRRLAVFDGALDVASPPGGPTIVTMELPCGLSSPRTSPSSGTG